MSKSALPGRAGHANIAVMFINLSPGAVGIQPVDFDDLIRLARQHGFGGIDIPGTAVADEATATRTRNLMQSAHLRPGVWRLPGSLFGEQATFDAELGKVRTVAPLLKVIGCDRATVWLMSGHNDRTYDENWAVHVRRLQALAGVLHPHDVRIGIEYLGPATIRAKFKHPFIHTLPEAMKLADAVNPRGSVGILFDTWHWWCAGETLDQIRQLLPGERIIEVHVNDARPDRTREQQIDNERALPLETGVIDAAGVLRLMNELGYDGPVITEPFNPARDRLAKLPRDEAAAEVGGWMKELFTKAGLF